MIVAFALALACASPPPALVVVVSLDTLRADRCGPWGGPPGLTPNLDRLATEGVVFTHAYATSNETRFSHASIFTGRWASELQPLDDGFHLPPGTPTLATILRAQGWRTAAFVAGGHVAREYGFDQGFEVFEDRWDYGSLMDTGRAAAAWLAAEDPTQPTLLFVHGYDVHPRYLKPTPFGYSRADVDHPGRARLAGRLPDGTAGIVADRLTLEQGTLELMTRGRRRFDDAAVRADPALAALALTDADVAHVRGLYDGAVGWVDAALGRFLADLDAQRRLDGALVVVLSDHGEALGERGVYHHRFALDDSTTHVPLIVRFPDGARGGTAVDAAVDLTAIVPTVLAHAGLGPPAGALGPDLAAWARGEVPATALAYAEGAERLLGVTDGPRRLVAEGLSPDNPWLVEGLRGLPADAPLYRGDPALREALVAWRARLPRASGAPAPAAVETSRRAGYWSSP